MKKSILRVLVLQFGDGGGHAVGVKAYQMMPAQDLMQHNAIGQAAKTHAQKDAGAKVGPPLWDVVGRPKGGIAGFAYSEGLKGKGGAWTYEDLYAFLTKPSAYVSGTKMTYPGEPDPQKRADILAYLQEDSDTHPAFPAK